MPRSPKKIQENSLLPYETTPQDPAEGTSKEEYRSRLAEYLKDPAFHQIEGFPIGTNEDILSLSDPPYFTACPNPFLPEILERWQQERLQTRKALGLPDDTSAVSGIKYSREPFAADVSEGKNDPIYNAHPYHTKVPHKAIMRYILHYTDPGDIVFDGFCGTGMTGVAAQLCGDKKAVEELGYTVKQDGRILDENSKPFSRLGPRKAVLNDLSPVATFIANSYNASIDVKAFEKEANQILNAVETEYGWMYETWHPHCDHPQKVKGMINFTVWSDVFTCPQCGNEMAFWEVCVDLSKKFLRDSWSCPGCGSLLSKTFIKELGALKVERAVELQFDPAIQKTVNRAKQIPVIINYSVGNKRFEKTPDEKDLALIKQINSFKITLDYPKLPMMFKGEGWGDTWRAGIHAGITHVHHFYTWRNLAVISLLYDKIFHGTNKKLRSWFTSSLAWCGRENRLHIGNYFGKKGGVITSLRGTWYIASLSIETNAILRFKYRITSSLTNTNSYLGDSIVIETKSSTQTGGNLFNCVDYIFIDPPFGDNLMYSELNFIWEAWLRVLTNNQTETIINNAQKKDIFRYQALMEECFTRFFTFLKPGHWITIEFHNSKNVVWNSIQEALLRAGFMVADVRTLDKGRGSFQQVTSTGAVKQDLVISAYKSSQEFQKQFKKEGGTEIGAWTFIRQHLEKLPLPNIKENTIESQAERMPYLLYDRMVAFHLVRGLTIPLSAGEFYTGLTGQYLSRDGMYFNSAQAAEYDRLRLKADRVEQLTLFVTDEQSAIQWLRQELDIVSGHGPQTYGDVQPHFIQQLHQEKYEQLPELKIVLEQNFLQDEAECWYIPDPDHQADLEKLRANALLHEFADYLKSRGKLRAFRAEAVRAGFSKAWKERQYDLIVQVAERLPEQALQEDAKLKIYYDNALGRAGRQPYQETLL
jgi:predicted RNA-binding Zn-ribbon protein involved in translation (DUF1610 family)